MKKNKRLIAGTLTGVMALSFISGFGIHYNPRTHKIEFHFGEQAYAFEDSKCIVNINRDFGIPILEHKNGSKSLAIGALGIFNQNEDSIEEIKQIADKNDTLLFVIPTKNKGVKWGIKTNSGEYKFFEDLENNMCSRFKEIQEGISVPDLQISEYKGSHSIETKDILTDGATIDKCKVVNNDLVLIHTTKNKWYTLGDYSINVKLPDEISDILNIVKEKDTTKLLCKMKDETTKEFTFNNLGVQTESKISSDEELKTENDKNTETEICEGLSLTNKNNVVTVKINHDNLDTSNLTELKDLKGDYTLNLKLSKIDTVKGTNSIVLTDTNNNNYIPCLNSSKPSNSHLVVMKKLSLTQAENVVPMSFYKVSKTVKEIIPSVNGYLFKLNDGRYIGFNGNEEIEKLNGYSDYKSWIESYVKNTVKKCIDTKSYSPKEFNISEITENLNKYISENSTQSLNKMYEVKAYIDFMNIMENLNKNLSDTVKSEFKCGEIIKQLNDTLTIIPNNKSDLYKYVNYMRTLFEYTVNMHKGVQTKTPQKPDTVFPEDSKLLADVYKINEEINKLCNGKVEDIMKILDSKDNKSLSNTIQLNDLTSAYTEGLPTSKAIMGRAFDSDKHFENVLKNINEELENLDKKESTDTLTPTEIERLNTISIDLNTSKSKDISEKIIPTLENTKKKVNEILSRYNAKSTKVIENKIKDLTIPLTDRPKENIGVDEVLNLYKEILKLPKENQLRQSTVKEYSELFKKIANKRLNNIQSRLPKIKGIVNDKTKQSLTHFLKELITDIELSGEKELSENIKSKLIEQLKPLIMNSALINPVENGNMNMVINTNLIRYINNIVADTSLKEIVNIPSDNYIQNLELKVNNLLSELNKNSNKEGFLNKENIISCMKSLTHIEDCVKTLSTETEKYGVGNKAKSKLSDIQKNIDKINAYKNLDMNKVKAIENIMNESKGKFITVEAMSAVSRWIDGLPATLQPVITLKSELQEISKCKDTDVVENIKSNLNNEIEELNKQLQSNAEKSPDELAKIIQTNYVQINDSITKSKDLEPFQLKDISNIIEKANKSLTNVNAETIQAIKNLTDTQNIQNKINELKLRNMIEDKEYTTLKELINGLDKTNKNKDNLLKLLDTEILPRTESAIKARISQELKTLKSLTSIDELSKAIEKLPNTDIEKQKIDELKSNKTQADELLKELVTLEKLDDIKPQSEQKEIKERVDALQTFDKKIDKLNSENLFKILFKKRVAKNISQVNNLFDVSKSISNAENKIKLAEQTPTQESLTTAEQAIESIPDIATYKDKKEQLLKQLEPIQSLVNNKLALDLVEISEREPTQDNYNKAYKVVKSLESNRTKSDLENRLKSVKETIETNKEIYNNAIQNIEKAEKSLLNEDYELAEESTKKVKEPLLLKPLTERVNRIRTSIDGEKIKIATATKEVETVENSKKKEDFEKALTSINEIKTEKAKSELLQRIKIIPILDVDMNEGVEKAEQAVLKAEKSREPLDISNARELISKLLNIAKRNEFTERLQRIQPIQKIMQQGENTEQAELAVSKAENSKRKQDVESARLIVSELKEPKNILSFNTRLDSIVLENEVSSQSLPAVTMMPSISTTPTSLAPTTATSVDTKVRMGVLPNITIKTDKVLVDLGNVDLAETSEERDLTVVVESNLPYDLYSRAVTNIVSSESKANTIDIHNLKIGVNDNYRSMSTSQDVAIAKSQRAGRNTLFTKFRLTREVDAKPGLYSAIIKFIARQR